MAKRGSMVDHHLAKFYNRLLALQAPRSRAVLALTGFAWLGTVGCGNSTNGSPSGIEAGASTADSALPPPSGDASVAPTDDSAPGFTSGPAVDSGSENLIDGSPPDVGSRPDIDAAEARPLGPDAADAATPGVGPGGGSLPGDIAAAGGTPLVAAHSMTRAMYSAYNGPLFQVRRASDGTTKDIGVATAGGLVDGNALKSFLSGTTGSVAILYDQSGNANDLPQATPANQPTMDYWARVDGTQMPMAVTVTRQWLRNRANTKKIPVGAASQTEYFVVHSKHYNAKCCYDYGNMEAKVVSDGSGTMNALNIGTSNNGFSAPGAGSGPWLMVDYESGVYTGPSRIGVVNANSPAITWDLAMALTKTNGTTSWVMKVGDATKGALTTTTSGGLPPGYNPLKQEGGLSLGEGGDGHSTLGAGAFFEGAVIAGVTSDAADDSIQANLVSVYGK